MMSTLNVPDSASEKLASSKKASVISNLTIAVVLLVLSLAIFTTDLTNIYLSVSAPLYNGNREQKNVSLMINVYGGTEFIKPMMDILTEKNVGATWFLGGTWAAKNLELVKEIGQLFELGNQAYTGKDLKPMSEADQRNEIQSTHSLIKGITSTEMRLFAPPSGSFSKTTLKAAESLSYSTIMWSKDTLDWRDKDENLVLTRATENLKNGDLILMHPTAHTVAALPKIIDFCKTQGFNVVNVSENIK